MKKTQRMRPRLYRENRLFNLFCCHVRFVGLLMGFGLFFGFIDPWARLCQCQPVSWWWQVVSCMYCVSFNCSPRFKMILQWQGLGSIFSLLIKKRKKKKNFNSICSLWKILPLITVTLIRLICESESVTVYILWICGTNNLGLVDEKMTWSMDSREDRQLQLAMCLWYTGIAVLMTISTGAQYAS